MADFWRWLRRRGQGRVAEAAGDCRPAILMYHRVAKVDRDPWGLAVSPDRFDRQMAYLRRHRRPLRLDEFVRRLQRGKLPADSVAVTFDDGYHDNLVAALPALERYRVPATLFVVTDHVARPRLFWWDELAHLLLARSDPLDVAIVIAGMTHALRWDFAGDLAAGWRAWDEPRDERERAYVAIWTQLRDLGEAERQDAMARLRKLLGDVGAEGDRSMNAGELQRFAASRVIDIGAHSINHPALTTLGPAERQREIGESRGVCRALAGREIRGFAYPYGDMDEAARADVVASGFAWACSTRWGTVAPDSDRFALPRLGVEDWDEAEFAAFLHSA